MTTLQISVDENLKRDSDALFAGLGLDTTTAVRIFLNAARENNGFPFAIRHARTNRESLEALEDARQGRNLSGPFDSAEAAVAAMLK